MSQINIAGDTSGSIAVVAPLVAGSNTITLPASTGTVLTSVSPASDLPSSIKGPAFSAYGNITQSISNNTATKISFNLEEFDTNNNYDSTTNYRFTPTVAGYYQINVAVRYETTAAITNNGEVYIQIRKNGSAYKRGWNSYGNLTAALTGAYLIVQCNSIVYFNGTTDYVEGWFYQNTGNTQTLRPDSEISYFNGSMIRSA
jgi:hypothetical protein